MIKLKIGIKQQSLTHLHIYILTVCTHCPKRGEEAILGSKSHIFVHEQGGIGFVCIHCII